MKKRESLPAMTKGDLAKIAGYTYRRLYDIDRNLPEDKRLFVESEGAKCDLAVFVQRWVDYNVSLEREADGKSLDEVRAIHEAVKTRKTELEVARMEGEMVDVDDVRRLWAQIADTVKQNILRLSAKLAPQLQMIESVQTITAILDTEFEAVLTAIADTPVPEYSKDAADDADEE